MKKIVKIIIVLLSCSILLDFIPVKKAIHLEKNKELNNYLCSYAQVTGGNWKVENYTTDEPLYFDQLYGNNPFEVLDENFTTDYLEPSGNKYIFTGDIHEKESLIYDLYITKWNIVYPIQRKSLRMLYTPKGYLTIYDYSWKGFFRKRRK